MSEKNTIQGNSLMYCSCTVKSIPWQNSCGTALFCMFIYSVRSHLWGTGSSCSRGRFSTIHSGSGKGHTVPFSVSFLMSQTQLTDMSTVLTHKTQGEETVQTSVQNSHNVHRFMKKCILSTDLFTQSPQPC